MLPPALSLQYQRVGAYGLLIVMLLLTVGRGVIDAWMKPAFVLFQKAAEVVFPYVLSSQWTR